MQQSLWESLCRIIPGIARTDTTSGAGGSGNPGATAMQENTQPASASQPSHKKTASREKWQGEAPLGIPPAGSRWAASSEFQNLPVVNLTGEDNPSTAQSQGSNAPIQATPLTGRRVSGGKINVSKVDAHHLLWKMEDRQEAARQRAEAEASDRATSRKRGSGSGLPYGLPAALPDLAAGEKTPAKPSGPAPAAPQQGKKCSHADDDDEIMEVPTGDEPVMPPKRKKKKKSKDKAKEEAPVPDIPDDGAHPSSSLAKLEEPGEPTPAADPPGIPDEETEQPKKKKKKKKNKKDPGLEKFREQEREAKAKDMARNVHQKLQPDLDFRSVRKYREKIPPELLETINGADHSDFLLEKLKKDGNYMNQKNGYRRNLMTTERLLARIAKHADDPDQCLQEAQALIRAPFSKVQGMATTEKSFPKLVIRVLVDCHDQVMDCDHHEYGKEQNIGLHDVFHPAAMARIMAKETHMVDGIPTKIKVDVAFCPLCNYTASHHRSLNNHVRMHLRAILVCGWPGCYFVHMQAVRMIEHSAEVHNMARAKPARGDKGGE